MVKVSGTGEAHKTAASILLGAQVAPWDTFLPRPRSPHPGRGPDPHFPARSQASERPTAHKSKGSAGSGGEALPPDRAQQPPRPALLTLRSSRGSLPGTGARPHYSTGTTRKELEFQDRGSWPRRPGEAIGTVGLAPEQGGPCLPLARQAQATVGGVGPAWWQRHLVASRRDNALVGT